MEVTSIQLIPIKSQKGLIAFAEVVLDSCLFLSSIGVHTKLDGGGYRITYPTKKAGFADIALFHPINMTLSKEIEAAVVAKAKELFK